MTDNVRHLRDYARKPLPAMQEQQTAEVVVLPMVRTARTPEEQCRREADEALAMAYLCSPLWPPADMLPPCDV